MACPQELSSCFYLHRWFTAAGNLLNVRGLALVVPALGSTSELWDLSQDKQKRMITSGSMPKQAEDGMRATLQRLAELLES